MADNTVPEDSEAAVPEAPQPGEVDNDPGVPVPQNEEQARQAGGDDDEATRRRAQEVARDTTVVGNTDIPGTGGGTRFFGADPQPDPPG